ncbi:MAG: hypothetical protein CMP10_18805 [Zetaproteobacteria bacterium]|nr:hypothetical protein [Pseudobdellovibrionaceae bacterium]|tara:strand:+ start:1308 stop:2801 length:1494 start_codon:yes stop_codon:yes gene_type:complete
MTVSNNSSWEKAQPKAISWLRDLKPGFVSEVVAGACHVVPIKKEGDSWKIAATLSEAIKVQLTKLAEQLGWNGDPVLSLPLDGSYFILVPEVVLETTTERRARQIGLDAVASLKGLKVDHLVFLSDDHWPALDIFEGLVSELESFDSFKKESKDPRFPREVSFLGSEVSETEFRNRCHLINSLLLTRLTQDAPPNWLNPTRFSEMSRAIMDGSGECIVLGQDELSEKGMGAMLSVSDGAEEPPQLIAMHIKGKDTSRTAALVGKGVTFDSGGISIKGSAGMDEMKYDMSGAGAVLGAAHYFSKVQPPINVVCVIGAVENMPSGKATRPGDIVKSYIGKTIEVLNTDAEGRMVLADALGWVSEKYKPEMILDMATLTGSVLHGLGHSGAAIMTTNSDFANFLKKVSGEPLWQLPLWPELGKEVKSKVADLKNIASGGVLAGSIMGGMFLKEFVQADTRWAHIDIAGTAWSCSATGYRKSGGSSFGVRTLINAVEHIDI